MYRARVLVLGNILSCSEVFCSYKTACLCPLNSNSPFSLTSPWQALGYLFVEVVAALNVTLTASHMLCKLSTTEPHPKASIVLFFNLYDFDHSRLEVCICVCVWLGIKPMASSRSGMLGKCPTTELYDHPDDDDDLFCFLFCWDRVSTCSPGWPVAHYKDQTGLQLTKIHLILHQKCWN